ncbi:MAG: hypothetical protein ACI9LA_001341, partial [Bacteroidia bacterium]
FLVQLKDDFDIKVIPYLFFNRLGGF